MAFLLLVRLPHLHSQEVMSCMHERLFGYFDEELHSDQIRPEIQAI